MLQIMTEIQRKILEQGIAVVILALVVWYLSEQLKEQKAELRGEIQLVSNRLTSCEADRYELSKKVAQFETLLGNLSPVVNRSTKKAK